MAEPKAVPKAEREIYKRWLIAFIGQENLPRNTFSMGALPQTAFNTSSPFYRIWLAQGKPTAEDWLTAFEPVVGDSGRISSWRSRPPQAEALPEFPGKSKIEEVLGGIKTAQELDATLGQWIDDKSITEEDAQKYYDRFGALNDPVGYFGMTQEIADYLDEARDKNDLADRVRRLSPDEGQARQLYEGFALRAGTTSGALSRSRGRSLAEEVELAGERESQRFQNEVARINEENDINALLDRIQRRQTRPSSENGDDLGGGRGEDLESTQRLIDLFKEGDYQPGLGQNIQDRLVNIGREQQLDQLRGVEEAEGRDRNMRAIRAGRENQLRSMFQRQAPAEAIIEQMVGSTGLGEGTRLANFLRGELTQAAQQPALSQERRSWWEDVVRTWGEPGADSPGKRRAQALIANPLATAEELTPVGAGMFGMGSGITADPLFRFLNLPKTRQRYFRQPGAGLVSRLTPAARF